MNRPTGDSIRRLAEDIERDTQIKKAFKGIRGGRKANAAVKAGRKLRGQSR